MRMSLVQWFACLAPGAIAGLMWPCYFWDLPSHSACPGTLGNRVVAQLAGEQGPVLAEKANVLAC